jgi:DNA-binding response OmpR family regulator
VHGLLRRRRWNEEIAPAEAPEEPGRPPETFSFAGRTIDFSTMQVTAGGTSYQLTLMECELLRYLVKNAGQPVSRRAILEDVWGLAEGTDTRAIDNFIVRLRRYIEDHPAAPKFLQTVRGVGYKFVPQP